MTGDLSSVEVMEKEDATFVCELSKPKQEVTWQIKGKKIKPNKKYEMSSDGKQYKLVIKDCQLSDASEVSCIAKDCKSTAQLIVKGTNKLNHLACLVFDTNAYLMSFRRGNVLNCTTMTLVTVMTKLNEYSLYVVDLFVPCTNVVSASFCILPFNSALVLFYISKNFTKNEGFKKNFHFILKGVIISFHTFNHSLSLAFSTITAFQLVVNRHWFIFCLVLFNSN